jgi:hypothetical protein
MATDSPGSSGTDESIPDGELTDFLSLLNELKATGCNLLLVGDARPELFTRASASLLGDAESLRYRLLAVTDASPRSVTDRLPEGAESPRPLAETTKLVNHAVTPRSVASTTEGVPTEFGEIPEVRVADPQLEGLESALVEGVEEFARDTAELRPATLRVGVDSVGTLLDHHGEDVVRRCLRNVGSRVRDHDAMAHYVLRDEYDSERVQSLADEVDAIIEIRSVNPERHGHDAQQRWHVPSRDLSIDWVRL